MYLISGADDKAGQDLRLPDHCIRLYCTDMGVLLAGGDRPYLISGADDKLVKIWDYQTKACVQTLDGHAHNIAAVSVLFACARGVLLTAQLCCLCD